MITKLKSTKKTQKVKQAIVIGETNLCIQCTKYLIDNNWQILFVVSDDQDVISWAKDTFIPTLPNSRMLEITEKGFYLFSIINPCLIPKSFLENKHIVLALNYHDSPLPRYAGVNSTTWAIINGEKQHGVTIHKIASGIDEGDIVAQSTIPIDKDETAISLNLKCSESALTLFQETIAKIEAGSLSAHKQDLKEKTYYGLKSIPHNYGVINGTKDIPTLYRLVRGLTFGDDYDNPVASVKIYLNGNFYIVEDFNASLSKTRQTASTNINTDTTLFNEVKDIYGNKTTDLAVRYKDILEDYALSNDELQFLSTIKIKERKYKQQILDFLSSYPDASIKILSHVANDQINHNYIKKFFIPEYISTNTLLALINFVLARFFHEDFILSLYFANKDTLPKLQKLVENRNFICVQKDFLKDGFTKLEYQLDQLQKDCYTLTKDFGYRYHLPLLTDIAIAIGDVITTDNHRMVIKIKDESIEIHGESSLQVQIDSIAELLTTVLSKNIQDEITTKDLRYINILSQEQYRNIVINYNKTDRDYPRDKTVHQLFEEQVQKTPNNIAVVYEDTKLTYQELNQRANQLANYLIHNYKIKSDNLVALCLDKSEYMIIAMLGVLKSGGAYVPIDPNNPDERVYYVLNDTNTKVILTNSIYENRLLHLIKNKEKSIDAIVLDNNKVQTNLINQKDVDPVTSTTNTNLVYVIYTSGTTGEPKGVMVEHRGVVSLVKNVDYVDINTNDTFIHFSNPMFDATTFEVWAPLLNGARLIIPESKVDLFGNIGFFSETLIKNKITILWLTKTLFDHLFIARENIFKGLKYLLIGGEALNPQLILKLINAAYKPKYVVNGYGPSENTTFSCTLDITNEGFVYTSTVPIGKPLTNRKAYVLDKNLNVLPVGAIGELCMAGDGLARGYLNSNNLTAKRFIFNPFQIGDEKSQNKNLKLYKTGDLVRMLPDGNLEYIGRNDSQIKIRGFRIELGEIENKLLNYPGVKQVIVVTKERITNNINDKYLLAYYVADKKMDEAKIAAYLRSQLPEYMLPQTFIYLDKLPLTTNGKLDKKALPEPKVIKTSNYIAPTTKLQQQIIDIWSEMLNVPKESISITDSFFSLGGNSILAIILVTKLSKIREGKDTKVMDIFKYPTIEKLANFVEPNAPDLDNKEIVTITAKKNLETEIAIIGISGAFSGCENIDQYWELIRNGVEGVKHYTTDECQQFAIPEDILSDPNFVPTSGHVPNIDRFDAEFWGLTPNEIKSTDPQIRKFLEHCWYILEESGYLAIRSKISVGIFAGSGNSNYLIGNRQIGGKSLLNPRNLYNLGAQDTLATKASYLLNLAGIAINVNTACSTSLTAVIEACIYLSSGYCDMAIAGGVSLLLPWEVGHIYQDGMIHSKDGYCRVFDNKSSGIIHGSGVGVVLLKRLSDAKRDNDNIIAVIKGYGINNDGNRKMSYTSPSIIGQKECIINAQNMAKITPELIDYVECHGTGTKLGDPIEVQALDEAFKYNSKKNNLKHKCIMGSVKANIGHADIAAGIASLIKVCKMLEYKIIPKQINYDIINTEIHLEDTNFEIATESRRWDKKSNALRIAGVSSFGIGGTNAHVIVSEYQPVQESQAKNTKSAKDTTRCVANNQPCSYVLPLSAKSSSSLISYKERFIDYLNKTTDSIENIAYTLQLKREHFDCRISIVCDSVPDAISKLSATDSINRTNNRGASEIVFMFPGQGNQYVNMSLGLYKHDNYYKNIVDGCIRLANKYTNVRFEKILFPELFNNNKNHNTSDISEHEIDQAKWAQLSLFIIEYSLAKLLEDLNINATTYIGHSIGEYVAATLAGVFTLEDAIKLVITRGQLMQSMLQGAMLSIQADIKEVEQHIRNSGCETAVINSPKNGVASGNYDDINNLKANLDKLNIPTTLLKVSHAYHSRLMGEASREFLSKIKQINFNRPQKRFISNVTGSFITDLEAIDPEYWARHMLNTVLFSEGIKSLFDTYNNPFFIEVGPGKSSISFVKHHNIGKSNVVQLLTSRKDHDVKIEDIYCKEDIVSKLWECGYNIDFNNYYNYKNSAKVVKLPSYCFNSSSYLVTPQNTDLLQPKITLDSNMDSSILTVDQEKIKGRVIEQDLSNKHYAVAKVFLDILGVENISINDDFFKLGGDSLLAVSLIAKLQQNYKVSVDDFLKFPSIANIAEKAIFIENNLQHKLDQIKAIYAKKSICSVRDVNDMLKKQASYLHSVEQMIVKEQNKDIRNVLLTGSTGHVGNNILYQLLHTTKYNIYLLIRAATSNEAFDRVKNRYKYYFDADLDIYKNRIIVLSSNIENPDLGLTPDQYKELVNNVDSIIHSAALVKHYRPYAESYQTNVQSTIHLLELSKLTTGKDFHYISTTGVLAQDGYVPNRSYFIFHEDDDAGILLERNNPYARTKYEGELIVNEYRKYGIASNIYRLGNVAMHSTSFKHQQNLGDNAFFIQLRTLMNIGMIYDRLLEAEVSPVDSTAEAIVKLFDQSYLSNQTYHIFNPHLCDLSSVFAKAGKKVNVYPIDEFIDKVIMLLNHNSDYSKQIELFMLHQKWLGTVNINATQIMVLQDKTNAILAKLGFSWPKITENMWSDIIEKAKMSLRLLKE